MISAALVQRDPRTGEFINPNVFMAWEGLTKLGFDTTSFTWPDLRDGKVELAKDVLVVGGVLSVRTAVEQLGCRVPDNIDYPDAVRPYLHREVKSTTLASVRSSVDSESPPLSLPVFVKPHDGHKAFDGHVVRRFRDLIRTAAFPSTTPVWAAGVVDFESEYRCFVRRANLVGVRHYAGDPLVFPDADVIRQVLDALEGLEDVLVAYTIDVGVLRTGPTAVVEINDGFAVGCYGLHANEYAKILVDRWCQMVDLPLLAW